MLAEGIRQLPARSRLIVSLYYVEELTPIEIAETLDISRSRVYQLHAKAIMELRAWMRLALNGKRPAAKTQAIYRREFALAHAVKTLDAYLGTPGAYVPQAISQEVIDIARKFEDYLQNG